MNVYVLGTELVTGEETRHYVGTSLRRALAVLKNSTAALDTGEEWTLEIWAGGKWQHSTRTRDAILKLEQWPRES